MSKLKKVLQKPGVNPLADSIREAVDAGPDDVIQITTPQFERPVGLPEPGKPPVDFVAFVAEVPLMSPEALRKIGFGAWGSPEDAEGNEIHGQGMLWLFPGEWYPHLPVGLKITTISFGEETFVPGKTDDDIRFGCLAYGVMGPELSPVAPSSFEEQLLEHSNSILECFDEEE